MGLGKVILSIFFFLILKIKIINITQLNFVFNLIRNLGCQYR